jgi:polyisoprenoid-binding protein YceI
MGIAPGAYTLGPESGTLTVHTRRGGAAAKAGHDLVMEVTKWRATLVVADQTTIELSADARSLRVREGKGGISALGEDDKAGIAQTIDEEVLKGAPIVFESTSVDNGGDRLDVRGDLELLGVRRPIDFSVAVGADGRLTGTARIKQTDWRIKPFSALFGTLKVADVVEVAIDTTLTRSEHLG